MEANLAGLVDHAYLDGRGRMKFWRVFGLFRRDRRGATAVEFALVASAFLMLVFTMIEATWMMTVEMAMNDAAQEASRLGSLGTLPATGSREESIKAQMVTRAAGLLDTTHLTVVMQSYGTPYNYGHHAVNATQTAGAGATRQLVQYAITYVQPVMTPLAIVALGGQTSFSHSTTIMVQNEPF